VQERPAIRYPSAIGGKSAAALLLALCCGPAFADLGETDSISAADAPLETTEDLNSRAPSISMAPRVETILREIFDESVPEGQAAAEATAISSPNAAPLAELTAPGLREKSRDIDSSDELKIRAAEKDVTGISTSVPGLSEDDRSRYRREMFRTDI
jgi:hypothetical protein